MSFAAKTVLKPIIMASHGCISSVPSLFTPSYSHPCLPIPFKPIKFQVSSYSSSHLLKKKEPISRVSVIAAHQEEDNPVLVEEKEGGEQLDWGASESELEGEDSEGAIEAVGDGGESDGYREPPEEAKLYVGNLPYDVDNETLAGLFGEAGVVEIVEIIYNRETEKSRGFGFVTMSTVEEAEKAIELFHRYDLNGRLLTVNIAGQRGERPPQVVEPRYRIYVGNLPWSVDDARLKELFSEYGKVVNVRVVSDWETGRSRGFGFIEMSSKSEMNDAIENLDGQNLDGRAINVNVAAERPR